MGATLRRMVAAVCAACALGWSAPSFAAADPETLPSRLLRTIQIGVPQDLRLEEISAVVHDPNADYSTTLLARSALLVLGRDDPRLFAYDALLDGALNHLVADGNAFPPPAGLINFRGKETVFTMVYAMVMSGNQERVIGVLEKHRFTGSKYKQGVVLSALRNVGTPRALGLIQQYAEKGQDRNLSETTLADEDIPVLSELRARVSVVPAEERTREKLLAIIKRGCDERPAMATYWLGFFAPNSNPQAERAEVDGLRAMVDSAGCDFIPRMIALKSLGLRSPETVDAWRERARRTTNVWERHQVVIDAFGRWGRRFASAALELLRTEPSQYIQWELMNGNLETRRGNVYRDVWDIWMPINVLALIEGSDGQGSSGMPAADVDDLLRWLESGGRPRDPVVFNHLLYNLARWTSGNDARRYLRVFADRANLADSWWILANLHEPEVLPLLRYWATLHAPPDQLETLQMVIGGLEQKLRSAAAPSEACCEPTEACLASQVNRSRASPPAAIRSENDARAWLAGAPAPKAAFDVRYQDELHRSATVRREGETAQRWEYLYDCWRRTDTESTNRRAATNR
jgi:hypothetical protein